MTKRNIFTALTATILLSFLSISCQPKGDDNTPEQATLSLSTNALQFDKLASNDTAPQVTVTTNQPKFTVSTTADWIMTEVSGNNIKVSALANDLERERKGDVLVFAGGLVEKVVVTQSAADIVLEVSPDKKTVTNKGDEILISVKSNSSTWTIGASTYDWMTIEKFTSELVKIVVAPNNNPGPREGKLFAKSGNVTKEIQITQVGIGSEDNKFFLPLIRKSPTAFDLIDYEAKQGNYLLTYSAANPSWGYNDDVYVFACSSKVFFSTIYEIDVTRNSLKQIFMRSFDPESLKSQEFKDFLTSKGFKIENVTDKGFEAIRESDNLNAKVSIAASSANESYVRFKYVPVQPKAFPTFTKFPYDKYEVLGNPEWPATKIIEEETKNGCKITTVTGAPDYPNFYLQVNAFPKKIDRETPHKRAYFIDTDLEKGTSTNLADEMMVIWEDYTLGVWKDGETAFVTKEFKELLQKEGFVFLLEKNNNQFYYNSAKSLVVVPRGSKFRDLFDGQTCLTINYFRLSEDGTALSNPTLRESILDKLAKRIEKHNRAIKQLNCNVLN